MLTIVTGRVCDSPGVVGFFFFRSRNRTGVGSNYIGQQKQHFQVGKNG
jgi:hypothetical protein